MIEKYKALEAENERLKGINSALCTKSNSYLIQNARLEEERDELKRQLAEYKADAERDATLFRNIRKLCGYVENGSDTTFSLFQDDATKDWIVKVGSKSYYSTSAAKAIDEAMKGATNDAYI